jgi:hypothetical protein
MRKLVRKCLLIGAVMGAGLAGYGGSAAVVGQSGACPTEGSCYREHCDQACQTNDCLGNCPDPGEAGSRCYVCAPQT